MRIIGHLDMDSFFASLEERASPQFKGKPIVVGSDPKEGKGRGVVSTANYLARSYGIHSAMPISKAWRLSLQAQGDGKEPVIFLPSNFSLYERSSQEVLEIIRRYSSCVEQGSIDEFYFDLSPYVDYVQAEVVCQNIKKAVLSEEKVTCSIGIAPNKLLAKIATGLNKPDGLSVIKEEGIREALDSLCINRIPGIGPKTEEALNKIGIVLIKDLMKLSELELESMLHNAGKAIYHKVRGFDDSPLVESRELQSIGEQSTFENDTIEPEIVIPMIIKLCDDVFSRVKKEGFSSFGKIVLAVRFSDFKTFSSSKSFLNQFMDIGIMKKEFLKLILPYLDKRKNPLMKKIRLVGIRVEKLDKLT
ncbi:MAG: DNA polymerase IV [Parcubacteria group bacterium ADurb.Bin216]|nr:MAG: DNA polymerase IV [Parcubacteria group bacterium ADurb.Bin216]